MTTHHLRESLHHLGTKVDHLNDVVKEHIVTDKHYYKEIDKLIASTEEDGNMNVMEMPAVLNAGGGNEAALIAAMMGGRHDGSGVGAGAGAGLGAGLLGGILGGALLGNRGLLGGGAVAEAAVGVTPAMLTAGLTGVTDQIQNTSIMQTLGDIKASVPLAEAQVQLALAGSTGEIRTHLGMVENGLVAGQALINKNVSDAIASSLASQNSIKESIAAYGVANLNATKDAQFALATIVKDDGEKTRALITANTISELQRELTVAQTAALEDRLGFRSRETEINITNTNTAVAQQQQQQAQQQQQVILLNGIIHALGGLQNAVATNSNMIIGNTGAVATGPQTANPVNVRT